MKIIKSKKRTPKALRFLQRVGFLTFLFLFTQSTAFAQGSPPPPPGGGGTGGNENQPGEGGGGAPIGGGTAILLALGAAYAGKKVYKHWKNIEE
jgi:hypothetical protein